MANTNNSLRIRTNINGDSFVNVSLNQTYDTFEILSLKLKSEDVYKLHSANYGVIIGRVLANENFGIPNAKISVFIEADFNDNSELVNLLYPYTSTSAKRDDVRYNLLTDTNINDCHQAVGTFPNKTYLLDNDVLIEVFDKYYVYTTRTNNSGDYIIAGVPIGQQTIHMDLDLSDCGILSQRPRDFVYKGYTIEQFENPNQFKTSKEIDSLSQIFTQNTTVNVIPFWGNGDNGETIGITRADINVPFKFEPTCVFMGSLVADNASNGVSKKCTPTNQMGAMDELTTGEGTIEMIRKTPGGNVEEFQVRGTELIDGNGVWCYQIPMNLDYMMTDEYGNMVPTDDPSKGIPTRARVRFRVSMHDAEANTDNFFRAKVLVPHNPANLSKGHEDYDYEFGTNTRENSFRDLFWNNVYTVKSYIPRFQKAKNNVKTERFSGIKHCNIYGQNNPMPYNNIRIKLPLIFTILCAFIKTYIRIVGFMNKIIYWVTRLLASSPIGLLLGRSTAERLVKNTKYIVLADGLCPDLENWYFAPGANTVKNFYKNGTPNAADIEVYGEGDRNNVFLLEETFNRLTGGTSSIDKTYEHNGRGMYTIVTPKEEDDDAILTDETSTDFQNSLPIGSKDNEGLSPNNRPRRTGADGATVSYKAARDAVCLTTNIDYLVSCVEMALAQAYKVINFDFYNDWVNGVIYMPRWMRDIRRKRTFLFGLITIKQKVKGCMDNTDIFNKTRYYVQQCALSYGKDNKNAYTEILTNNGCTETRGKQKCHTIRGRRYYPIFGGSKKLGKKGNGGIVHENTTMLNEYVYYFKPCEWNENNNRKTLLFANDLVLLGSLNDCSMYGIPQAFKYLKSSSYVMPSNIALTNMDDEAYLYATPDGTICSSSKDFETEGMNRLNPSFANEEKYYSALTTDEGKLVYGQSQNDGSEDTGVVDIFDDTIPLTEAAGISWNYTGPGQGEKSEDVDASLYMPGGHFLGISCFNSETNIKSCINLQRVCEIGSTISQRREEIRELVLNDESGQEYKIKYRYFVPTGLISNDEIDGDDFRTMFATMNSHRLLCDNNFVDEKTGYPFYKFTYMRNTGFAGELKSVIYKDDSWNKQLTIEDEYSNLSGKIAKDANSYDEEESGETYTRTMETPNYDYYMFRFGLTTMNDDEQKKHFLQQNINAVALPQYENSFYFYFGLREGATAFDEFNKQFFSTCAPNQLDNRRLTIGVKTNFDECNLTTEVIVTGKDAVAPLTVSYTLEDGTSGETFEDVQITNGYYSVTIPDLPRGTYIFKAVDGTGTEVQRRVELAGNNDVDAIIGVERFFFTPGSGLTPQEVSQSASTYACGYIAVSNVAFNNNVISGTPNVTIVAKDKDGNAVNYFTTATGEQPSDIGTQLTGIVTATSIYDILDGESYGDTGEDGTILVFVWSAATNYDVYIWNECDPAKYYFYGTYYVDGVEEIDLYLGDSDFRIPYKEELSKLSAQPIYDDGKYWWEIIGDDTNNILSDEYKNWYLRYYLLKRNLSGEPFTNNVIGANVAGTQIPTALFGQPEKYSSDISGYTLIDGICYEDDLRLDGVVSDTSYIPNWPQYNRKLFGEMATNGHMIGGLPVASISVADININYLVDHYEFDVSQDVLPDEELDNYVVISGNTKYGYFIARSDDGILYYLTLEYNGSNRVFKYEGRRMTGSVLTLYPTFYYPVMEKTFDAKMYEVEWLNPKIILGSSSDSALGNFEVKYENEVFIVNIQAMNGLTYEGKYDNMSFAPFGEFPFKRDDGMEDDLLLPVAIGSRTRKSGYIESYSSTTFCQFSVTEGYPDDLTFEPKVLTIGDSFSAEMATYITYREENEKIVFYNDINDETNNYYIVRNSVIPNPLEKLDAVMYPFDWASADKILYLGRFGADSDTLLNVIKEEGTYLQYPGQFVLVEADDDGYRFRYKVNSTTNQYILKEMQYSGAISGKTSLIFEDGIPAYDITFEKNDYWPSVPEYGDSTVSDYVEEIFDNIGSNVIQIPHFGTEEYLTLEENDYIVCIIATERIKYVRIYKPINLGEYNNNSSVPYLILIPHGTDGVYN